MPAETAPAIVAGGARGIGAAVAYELSTQPWISEVIIADVLMDEARAVVNRISRAGGSARSHRVDVMDSSSMEALIAAVPGIKYAAISVGITHIRSAEESDIESFRDVIEVNLIGVFQLARLLARRMSANGGGAIVALASVAASVARVNQAAYGASKAGVRQALRSLGLEFAPHVRINTVSPGATDTEMTRDFLRMNEPEVDLVVEDLSRGSINSYRGRIPIGRVATPAEIAAAVVFLLSPGASHITLQDLVVDGGELLGA